MWHFADLAIKEGVFQLSERHIYITGVTGFIGAYLKRYLKVAGYSVTGVSRIVELADGNIQDCDDRFSVKLIDYASLHSMAKSGHLNGVTIVHCAGRAHVMRETAESAEREYLRFNTEVTRQVRDAAIVGNVHQLIFLSSIKVNGEVSINPFSALDEPQPEDAYGRSKLASEKLLQDSSEGKTLFTIVRLPLVYGPGVKGNMAALSKGLKKGYPLPFASISNRRDLVSLKNLSSFIEYLIRCPPLKSCVWMVSDGVRLSTPAICRLMAEGLNRKARIFPIPVNWMRWIFRIIGKDTLSDRLLANLEVDISQSLALGWRPVQTPRDGFDEMYKDVLWGDS